MPCPLRPELTTGGVVPNNAIVTTKWEVTIMPNLSRLTDCQLCRLYRQVWKRIENRLEGGMSFGVDMRTLQIVAPGLAATIATVRNEMRGRPGFANDFNFVD